MFEAGALSKRIDVSRVCPVLFGVDNADLEGPLVQFQASPFNEAEVRKLMKTLNSGLGEQRLDEAVLASVFEMWWPKLNEKISKILERHAAKPSGTSSTRSDREILEEVLQLSRLNSSKSANASRVDRIERVDPTAIIHSLKHIMYLCEYAQEEPQPPAFTTLIRGIFDPLRYVADEFLHSSKHKREITEISASIQSMLDEVI